MTSTTCLYFFKPCQTVQVVWMVNKPNTRGLILILRSVSNNRSWKDICSCTQSVWLPGCKICLYKKIIEGWWDDEWQIQNTIQNLLLLLYQVSSIRDRCRCCVIWNSQILVNTTKVKTKYYLQIVFINPKAGDSILMKSTLFSSLKIQSEICRFYLEVFAGFVDMSRVYWLILRT